jgi:hypothetical protein
MYYRDAGFILLCCKRGGNLMHLSLESDQVNHTGPRFLLGEIPWLPGHFHVAPQSQNYSYDDETQGIARKMQGFTL